MVCFAMICFGLAATTGSWLVVLFVILFGIGYGGAIALTASLPRVLFGRKYFGSIYGLIGGIAVIGNITGPPLAGLVYDSYGTYQWFWLITAGITAVGMIIILTVNIDEM